MEGIAEPPAADEVTWYSNESREARRFSWAMALVFYLISSVFAFIMISSYFSTGFFPYLPTAIFFQVYGILTFSLSLYVDTYKLPYRIGIGTKGIYGKSRRPKYDVFIPWKDMYCIRRDRFFRKGYEIPCCYGKKRTKDALPVTKEIGEALIRTRSSVLLAVNKDFKIL